MIGFSGRENTSWENRFWFIILVSYNIPFMFNVYDKGALLFYICSAHLNCYLHFLEDLPRFRGNHVHTERSDTKINRYNNY